MKLNIANPSTGLQKVIDVDDDKKLHPFMEKRMAAEISGDSLGDEFKGYVFKITGGNDKQGFPMMQGVLCNHRVRLLLNKDHSCYRPRRTGERKRKSVRGCITAQDLAVMSLVIVKKGENELPGLTDSSIPRPLGPKRASKIRKLFNLKKGDDVRKFVVRREITTKDGKTKSKAPKIQRLVTPVVLQRKRHRLALKRTRAEKSRDEKKEYEKLLVERRTESFKVRREAHLARKRTETPKAVSA